FFNQPYLAKQIIEGEEIKVFGTWDASRMQLSGIKIIGGETANKNEKFEPIYHSSKDISHAVIKKLVQQAWDKYHQEIHEIVPDELILKYKLVPIKEAIYNMHFPKNPEVMDIARSTIVFMRSEEHTSELQSRF